MLRRRWRLLILVPLLAACAATAFLTIKGPTYTASANLLVSPGTAPGSDPTNTIAAGNLLAKTYAQLMVSPTVLDDVIAQLKLAETEQHLAARIRVSVPSNTQILTVEAIDRNPQAAAQLANTTSKVFISWLTDLQGQRSSDGGAALQSALDDAQSNMSKLSVQEATIRAKSATPTADDAQQLAQLEASRQQYQNVYTSLLTVQQQIRTDQSATRDQVQLAAPAQVPQRANGLPVAVTAAVAALLAFLVMATIVVVREQANRRAESSRDIRQVVNVPVLATIPELPQQQSLVSLADPDSPTSEAIRMLRLRLTAAAGKEGIGAVSFVGAEEEHPAIAANVAVSLAQAGKQVVLVDAHLRNPRANDLFRAPNGVGLAYLLASKTWPDESLPLLFLTDSNVPGLRLLLAGNTTTSTAELMQQQQFERIIAALRPLSDAIVIDAPPLLQSADGLLSAIAADHTIVMVEAGQTHLDALERSVESLRLSHADVLGVVFSGAGGGRSGVAAKRAVIESATEQTPKKATRKFGVLGRRMARANGR